MFAFKKSFTLMAPRRSFKLMAPRPALVALQSLRFSTFKEKERGEEMVYFSREDAKLLKGLLQKMEAGHDVDEA